MPELVPVRHGRMLVSPFTYFRGAALPMAADLAQTPTSGLRVQLCGDAHLANFGAYASPERRLVFDVNDFDETLPGPFEWDVKRLAASLEVAGRDNGYARKDRRKIVLAAVAGYRTAMLEFADQPLLAVWYAHLNIEDALAQLKSKITNKRYKANEELIARAHTRDSTQALNKLTTLVDGQRRITSDPPLIVPMEDVFAEIAADELYEMLRSLIAKYRRSLQTDRRHLLEQFTLVQAARNVVGVGSVGTRAWILLMVTGHGAEPLVLQAKEPDLGAERLRWQEPVLEPGRAGRRRAASHASHQRHLPRLSAHTEPRRDRPRLLRPPAAGLERLRRDRADGSQQRGRLRPSVRLDASQGARALRGPRGHRVLPRQVRHVRQGRRRLRHDLRRPERALPRGASGSRTHRPDTGPDRTMSTVRRAR